LQRIAAYCSVLQCIAVYCSVLQCIAVYCSLWQSVVFGTIALHVRLLLKMRSLSRSPIDSRRRLVCCSVLHCIAVCCSVLQCVAVCAVCCSMLQYVALCCSMLQYAAVCYSMLQHVAVCCSVLQCAEDRLSRSLRSRNWVTLSSSLNKMSGLFVQVPYKNMTLL